MIIMKETDHLFPALLQSHSCVIIGGNGEKRKARSVVSVVKASPIFKANSVLFEKYSLTCRRKIKFSLLKYSGTLVTALL